MTYESKTMILCPHAIILADKTESRLKFIESN